MHTSNRNSQKERGAAHLVLILAFVVALIGVLGFLGYNAWQKQNANAGDESTLAKGGRGGGGIYAQCRTSVTASPAPNYHTSSKYSVRATAKGGDTKVRISLAFQAANGSNAIPVNKEGSWVSIKQGQTKTVNFTASAPRTVGGEPTRYVTAYVYTSSNGSQDCHPEGKRFTVSPVAD